jgi:hypothetical protein
MGVLPGVVPLGVFPPAPPAPPAPPVEPEPEPAAWPGLRFSVALAARATKADMVLLPDAGLVNGQYASQIVE